MTLRNATGEYPIYIEAIMAFSAGSIHVGEYERVLQDAQDVDKRVNRRSEPATAPCPYASRRRDTEGYRF